MFTSVCPLTGDCKDLKDYPCVGTASQAMLLQSQY